MKDRLLVNTKKYFVDLPTIVPVNGETWQEVNKRSSEIVRRIAREHTELPEYKTTFADDVIQFFSGGIGTNLFQNYVRYAMNSLYRGAKIVNEVVGGDTEVVRYLDVGCAYGGCPIVMAETNNAIECVGIEYENRLLGLAEKLAQERGVSDKVKFHCADITDFDAVGHYGKFDLITCLDVLEHVLDPDEAIRSLASLMSNNGCLRVDIPNKYSFHQIRSDPHHHLFGSVLLTRPDAIRVFEHEFPGNKRYTVGYFHPLEWYIERFKAYGVSVEILDSVEIDDSALQKTVDSVFEVGYLLDSISPGDVHWPSWRIDMVSKMIKEIFIIVEEDMNRVRAGLLDPELFQIRYSVPVFHLKCSNT